MGYWDYGMGMIISLEYAAGAVRADFTMGDMFFGFNFVSDAGKFGVDLFFMSSDAPLLRVEVTVAEGGARTLAVDAAGKTVLAAEEIMADGNSEAAQGLYMDVYGNGLGALMGGAMQQVPELPSLMGMAG